MTPREIIAKVKPFARGHSVRASAEVIDETDGEREVYAGAVFERGSSLVGDDHQRMLAHACLLPTADAVIASLVQQLSEPDRCRCWECKKTPKPPEERATVSPSDGGPL